MGFKLETEFWWYPNAKIPHKARYLSLWASSNAGYNENYKNDTDYIKAYTLEDIWGTLPTSMHIKMHEYYLRIENCFNAVIIDYHSLEDAI